MTLRKDRMEQIAKLAGLHGPVLWLAHNGRLVCPYCDLCVGQDGDPPVYVEEHESPCGLRCVGSAKKFWVALDNMHSGARSCPRCTIKACPECGGIGATIHTDTPDQHSLQTCQRCDGMGYLRGVVEDTPKVKVSPGGKVVNSTVSYAVTTKKI